MEVNSNVDVVTVEPAVGDKRGTIIPAKKVDLSLAEAFLQNNCPLDVAVPTRVDVPRAGGAVQVPLQATGASSLLPVPIDDVGDIASLVGVPFDGVAVLLQGFTSGEAVLVILEGQNAHNVIANVRASSADDGGNLYRVLLNGCPVSVDLQAASAPTFSELYLVKERDVDQLLVSCQFSVSALSSRRGVRRYTVVDGAASPGKLAVWDDISSGKDFFGLCLPCRISFSTRLVFASHASAQHGSKMESRDDATRSMVKPCDAAVILHAEAGHHEKVMLFRYGKGRALSLASQEDLLSHAETGDASESLHRGRPQQRYVDSQKPEDNADRGSEGGAQPRARGTAGEGSCRPSDDAESLADDGDAISRGCYAKDEPASPGTASDDSQDCQSGSLTASGPPLGSSGLAAAAAAATSLAGAAAFSHSRNSCKTLKCPKCNWHYKYQETLEIHMKEKHAESEARCIYCASGEAHPKLARGESYACGYKPYRCSVCNYSTTTKGNLSIHMQSDKHVNNMQELQGRGSPAAAAVPLAVARDAAATPSTAQPLASVADVGVEVSGIRGGSGRQKQQKSHWRCDVCGYETSVARNLRIHMNSEKHTHNMALLQQNVRSLQRDMQLQGNSLHLQHAAAVARQRLAAPCASEEQAALHQRAATAALYSFDNMQQQCRQNGTVVQPSTSAGALSSVLGEGSRSSRASSGGTAAHSPHAGKGHLGELDRLGVHRAAENLFSCITCGGAFSTGSVAALSEHLAASRMACAGRAADHVTLTAEGHYLCNLCCYRTNLKANFQLHCKTDKHVQRVQLVGHIREGGPGNLWRLQCLSTANPVDVVCNACDFQASSTAKLEVHCAASTHAALAALFEHACRLAGSEAAATAEYYCGACDCRTYNGAVGLAAHVRTMHAEMLEMLARNGWAHFTVVSEHPDTVSGDSRSCCGDLEEGTPTGEEKENHAVVARTAMPGAVKMEPAHGAQMGDSCGLSPATKGWLPEDKTTAQSGEAEIWCPYCTYKSRSAHLTRAHVMSQHAPAERLACPLCTDTCASTQKLLGHLSVVHSVSRDAASRLLGMLSGQRQEPASAASYESARLRPTAVSNEHESLTLVEDLPHHHQVKRRPSKTSGAAVRPNCLPSNMLCNTGGSTRKVDVQPELNGAEGGTLSCERCCQTFSSSVMLTDHIVAGKCSQVVTQCFICHRYFKNWGSLQKHLETCHFDSMTERELEQYRNIMTAALHGSGIGGNHKDKDAVSPQSSASLWSPVQSLYDSKVAENRDVRRTGVAAVSSADHGDGCAATGQAFEKVTSDGATVLPSSVHDEDRLCGAASGTTTGRNSDSVHNFGGSSRRGSQSRHSVDVSQWSPSAKKLVQKQLLLSFGMECVMQYNEQTQQEEAHPPMEDSAVTRGIGQSTAEAAGEQRASSDSEVSVPEMDGLYRCNDCGKRFSGLWVLKAHQEDVHRKQVPLRMIESVGLVLLDEYTRRGLLPLRSGGVIQDPDLLRCRPVSTMPTSACDGRRAPPLAIGRPLPGVATEGLPRNTQQLVASGGSAGVSGHPAGSRMESPPGCLPHTPIDMMSFLPLMNMLQSPYMSAVHQLFPMVMSHSAAAAAASNVSSAGGMLSPADPRCVAQQKPPQQHPLPAGIAQSDSKRARTRISDEQLKVLRGYFDINNSPSEAQIGEMSGRSGLPPKVIKHWFRNTLFKERQKNKDSPYNFNNPPQTTLNVEEYEKTGRMPKLSHNVGSVAAEADAHLCLPTDSSYAASHEVASAPKGPTDVVVATAASSSSHEQQSEEDSLLMSPATPSSTSSGTQGCDEGAHGGVAGAGIAGGRLPSHGPSSDAHIHAGSGGSSSGKRASRTRFTDSQVRLLQDYFDQNAYPKDEDLDHLSKVLALPNRVIVVWFQNARQKARKVYENQPAEGSKAAAGHGSAHQALTTNGQVTAVSTGQAMPAGAMNYPCRKCGAAFAGYYELVKHQKKACYKDEDIPPPFLAGRDGGSGAFPPDDLERRHASNNKEATMEFVGGSRDTTSEGGQSLSRSEQKMTRPSTTSHDVLPVAGSVKSEPFAYPPLSPASWPSGLPALKSPTPAINGSRAEPFADISHDQHQPSLKPREMHEASLSSCVGSAGSALPVRPLSLELHQRNSATDKTRVPRLSSEPCSGSSATAQSPFGGSSAGAATPAAASAPTESPLDLSGGRQPAKSSSVDDNDVFASHSHSASPDDSQQSEAYSEEAGGGERDSGEGVRRPPSPSGGEALHSSGNKRFRTNLSTMQVFVMKHLFRRYKTPTMAECESLGTVLGLAKRVVQVWFQNARAKDKRLKLASSSDDNGSTPSNASSAGDDDGCSVCGVTYTHKYTMQDHMFTAKHIAAVKRLFVGETPDSGAETARASEWSALPSLSICRIREAPVTAAQPLPLTRPRNSVSAGMPQQGGLPRAHGILSAGTSGPRHRRGSGSHVSKRTYEETSAAVASRTPVPSAVAAGAAAAAAAASAMLSRSLGIQPAAADLLPFMYPGLMSAAGAGFFPQFQLPFLQSIAAGGIHLDQLSCAPVDFGTPLNVLQMPQRAISTISARLADVTCRSAHYTQDCLSLDDLQAMLAPQDLTCIRAVYVDIGYICRKCKLVFPRREFCVAHQSLVCHAASKRLMSEAELTARILKLEQLQFGCVVCNETFAAIHEFKEHCSQETHASAYRRCQQPHRRAASSSSAVGREGDEGDSQTAKRPRIE